VATIRPDYPGLNKAVVAGEPAKTEQPATAPAAEPQKAPEVTPPAGVSEKQAPASLKTAQANTTAANAGAK